MSSRQLQLGSFVQVSGPLSGLGIGKVVSHIPGYATVEYFYSISNRKRETVSEAKIQPVVKVAAQTRCYLMGEDGRWRMGRIGGKDGSEYEVRFRQGEARYLPESQIYIRCLTPIEDPIDTLVYKGHETPFFHDHRFTLVRSLVQQRSLSRGMSGLLSSRIDLLPHQVEVVRRVLEDPIQRYLLADEVGLGKTVEAGVVLRQYMLDNPDGSAVVIVPPLLVDQWSEELEDKFQVSRFGTGRVTVLSYNEAESTPISGRVGLVIIDEAHHIAALAWADTPKENCRFAHFERLCLSAKALILLSATPALSNERDFLAMLHLLDPSIYSLDDIDAFFERVRNRQEVGQLLLSLQEGSPSFAIMSAINRLREYFPADAPLAKLCVDLQSAVSLTPPDINARDTVIRSVRVHMSETYRLHRRMLRNRRSGVEVKALAGRAASGKDTPRTIEYDLDERAPRIHELLEEWRDTAVQSVVAGQGAFTGSETEESLMRVFQVLYLAAGTWTGALQKIVEARLNSNSHIPEALEFAGSEFMILMRTPLFNGEREILEGMLGILDSPSEEGDRIELLKQSLEYTREGARDCTPPKCVVFTSHSIVCREILLQLRTAFGGNIVAGYHSGMSRREVEAEINRFRRMSDCFVLICDRAGEEGRNLQFADRVVHFDLPLSPNRMEQRIGRLDRIGRHTPIKSTIFIGPECEHSLFESWYRVLHNGFRVFDQSIASLQFFVEKQLPVLIHALFRHGATGLVDFVEAVQIGIAEEQKRLNEQDALDAVDAFEQSAVAYHDSLRTLEANYAEIEAAVHGWVGRALGFIRDRNLYRNQGTVRYSPEFDNYGQHKTLVPSDWLHRFAPHLSTPGAFDRAIALRISGTPVYRIGEGFIDEITRYLGWDDRGQAFALWRQEPNWDPSEGAEWIGFRFNYVVSTDLRPAKRILEERGLPISAADALSRRADALFPPLVEVVHLDTDGAQPTNTELLTVLERFYLARDKGGTDYNLANERLEAIDEVLPASLWENACRTARERSGAEVLNRGTPPLRERCHALSLQADRVLSSRLAQLHVHCARQHGTPDSASLDDLEIEAKLNKSLVLGIRNPQLRLDSVGFIVISGRPPRLGGAT